MRLFGVEALRADGFVAAQLAGHPVPVQVEPTLADGLAVSKVGELAFSIAAPRVERVVTVDEESIALAMLRLVELEKSVVEGAGATTLAACMTGKLPEIAGLRTVLVLSGGNVDPSVLGRVIDIGRVADGRLCRFTAVVSDRPGGLARLTQAIAEVARAFKTFCTTGHLPDPTWDWPTCCAPSRPKTANTWNGCSHD